MGFLLTCICSSLITFAQDPFSNNKKAERPLLFAGLPPKSVCNFSELQKTIHYLKADQISIKLSDNLLLSGEVIEKVETSPGIQNLNIRLSNFGNALLNISIISQPDKTDKIVGRIIHPRHADALVIAEENGKYYITKHKMEFFMVE
jgi:hypothetical protein